MWLSICVCVLTCAAMILCVLFLPKFRFGKFDVDSYWVVTLLGAMVMLALGTVDFDTVGDALVADTAINPLKILALFICMTVLSVFLDELGFFGYLAAAVLKHTHMGQKKLFFLLYVIVSVLTIFTSNDIIILSFTPFICHFARNARIDPKPYLAAEFVAANTCSLALIIGNPTNIYLATAFDMDFLSYIKISALPTLLAGVAAFVALYAMFAKKLEKPILGVASEVEIKDKLLLVIGVVHLVACTIMLAISSYIGIEMWLVSLVAAGSLALCVLIIGAFRRSVPKALIGTAGRIPYQIVPFMLSMFIIVVALDKNGVTKALADLIGGGATTALKYGVVSFVGSNLINNIPMSVLFSSVITNIGRDGALAATFATIIGSNIGAYLTPIGALAGIMFSSIVSVHGVEFSYADFVKIGAVVAIPALFGAIAGLYAMLAIV